MIAWIQQNAATLVISALLAATLALIIRKLVRDRKSGSCGCGCNGCPSQGTCHPSPKK